MKIPLFQVDAFADRAFRGNPAAVCPLERWLPDVVMQDIAAENNLSETAFFVRTGDRFALRWFTPAVEVDLCGHATLAAAWIIRTELPAAPDPMIFETRSGELRVSARAGALRMDFPLVAAEPCEPPAGLLPALGLNGATVLAAEDFIIVVDREEIVAGLTPDFRGLRGLPRRGVAVTAPGKDCDFVSRWFGPNVGVDEDPVTGSAHTSLAPYWATRLARSRLTARQGGLRQGEIICEIGNDRVILEGRAVTYLRGEIDIPSR